MDIIATSVKVNPSGLLLGSVVGVELVVLTVISMENMLIGHFVNVVTVGDIEKAFMSSRYLAKSVLS